MRAVFLEGGVELRHLPRPRVGPGEALVRVRLAGICRTDLELARGYMGFRGVPGHEFVGIVEESPDPAWRGRRVVGEINCGCGRCTWCGGGDPRHCPERTVLGILGRGGAFADYLALPLANLHAVPPDLSDEAAVFTEPLAAAFEILEQVPVAPGHRVLVLGDGKLGLLIAQVLGRTGCDLTVVGRHPQKLALVDGATTLLTDDFNPSDQWDVVVEATGSAGGLATALQAVRPRGWLVLKTTVADPATLDLAPLVVKEVTLVGSRCGPFAPALRALSRGHVRVEPLVAARFPLSQAAAAFEQASRPGVLKVLLDCRGT